MKASRHGENPSDIYFSKAKMDSENDTSMRLQDVTTTDAEDTKHNTSQLTPKRKDFKSTAQKNTNTSWNIDISQSKMDLN